MPSVEDGRGKLIGKTFLVMMMMTKVITRSVLTDMITDDIDDNDDDDKEIAPRKNVEVRTRVTACSPCRHPALLRHPCNIYFSY